MKLPKIFFIIQQQHMYIFISLILSITILDIILLEGIFINVSKVLLYAFNLDAIIKYII